MGLDGAPGVRETMSDALAARRRGKTCFNVTHSDESLLVELDRLTARVINAMRAAQYMGS